MLTRSSLIGGRELIATHRVHFNCSQLPETRARARSAGRIIVSAVCLSQVAIRLFTVATLAEPWLV
jgi:hypothetical protein